MGAKNPRKFKLFMLKRGVKQMEVADATGWSESKVSNLANGRRRPTTAELDALSKVFDMPADRLKKECGW